MAAIPKRVSERLVTGIKKFQPIVTSQKSADIGEADTVMLVTELLAEVFGYDKFSEITSQLAIKNTYCDLATKVDEKVQTLIEVKAIGHILKDNHVTQAVNYAANHGIAWAILTNGQNWRAYCVTCEGQIQQELVVDIDFLALNYKSDEDLELLFLLCKEGWAKSAIDDYQEHRKAVNRFIVSATLLSDRMLDRLRTELRRVAPEARIEISDVKSVLENEVIKRELLEGEKAEQAKGLVRRAAKVALREVAQSST